MVEPVQFPDASKANDEARPACDASPADALVAPPQVARECSVLARVLLFPQVTRKIARDFSVQITRRILARYVKAHNPARISRKLLKGALCRSSVYSSLLARARSPGYSARQC